MNRVLLACVIVLTGCGYKGENPTNIVPVQGKILTAQGTPAAWVALEFVPTKTGMAPAFAESDATGRFIPTTLNNQQGMVPGPYKVVARAMKKSGASPVPPKLGDDQTTTLEVNVSGGDLSVQLK